jgi:hypothetical protein
MYDRFGLNEETLLLKRFDIPHSIPAQFYPLLSKTPILKKLK